MERTKNAHQAMSSAAWGFITDLRRLWAQESRQDRGLYKELRTVSYSRF